jgi:hypothetical protein
VHPFLDYSVVHPCLDYSVVHPCLILSCFQCELCFLEYHSCKVLPFLATRTRREQRYQYLAIGRDKSYFVKSYSKCNNKYKQDETIQMLDFIIDNIFVLFSGWVFQQMIGFPMGTNCVSLLADSFLYAYGTELLKNKDRKLAQTLTSTFRFIDDVLSLHNSRFDNYLHRI